MDDEAVSLFCGITGASEDIAKRYLAFTDQNPEQAVQLFFDSPDLATGASEPQPPPIPTSSRPTPAARNPDADGSDNDAMDVDDSDDGGYGSSAAAAIAHAQDVEDDEAMARRLQNEMYAGGDASGGFGGGFSEDEVRAPIQRTTETLVGGPQDWGNHDIDEAVFQQMQARAVARRAFFSRTRLHI